jgi:hypothetical protein
MLILVKLGELFHTVLSRICRVQGFSCLGLVVSRVCRVQGLSCPGFVLSRVCRNILPVPYRVFFFTNKPQRRRGDCYCHGVLSMPHLASSIFI